MFFYRMYEQSTAEIERKIIEEADEKYHIIEEEHKTRSVVFFFFFFAFEIT